MTDELPDGFEGALVFGRTSDDDSGVAESEGASPEVPGAAGAFRPEPPPRPAPRPQLRTLPDVDVPGAEATAFALHLLSLRSAIRVGMMLVAAFPDEEAVADFFNREDVLDGLQAFGEARGDVAALAMRGAGLDEARLAAAVREHHPRALESLELIAEEIGVDAMDLASVLLHV